MNLKFILILNKFYFKYKKNFLPFNSDWLAKLKIFSILFLSNHFLFLLQIIWLLGSLPFNCIIKWFVILWLIWSLELIPRLTPDLWLILRIRSEFEYVSCDFWIDNI